MYRRQLTMALICALIVGSSILVSSAHGAPPDLVGWWKLDETSGTVAVDASGNGNDGTLMGDPQWASGRLGGAVELDGAGDYVDCGAGDPLNLTDQVTIACWLKVRTFTKAWQTIVGKGDNYQLERNDQLDVVNFYIGTPGRRTGPGVTNVNDGEWHHAAGAYDGAAMRLYIDGVLDKEAAITGPLSPDADPVYMGENPQWTNRHFDGWIDDVQIYSRALSSDEIVTIMNGLDLGSAIDPTPQDTALDVPQDVELAWTPGPFAATHDVYFGTSFDDVNDASRADDRGMLVSQGQLQATYLPEAGLDFGQTYYWRVDEVNAAPDNTVFKGDVWSFTVEPFAYPIQSIIATASHTETGAGPENTINSSGLDDKDQHSINAADMWLASPGGAAAWIQYEFDRTYKLYEMLVWNYNVQFELALGFGVKDVTIEYSQDGVDWLTLGDVQLAQGTAQSTYAANTTVDMQGVMARFMRLTVNSGWGPMGQYGLSEVRFSQTPVAARQPQPADGAADVEPEVLLDWRAGREADAHEVYLSSDETAVLDGTALIGKVTETHLATGSLSLGTAYYWKVDELNESDGSVVAGDVWMFSTREYAVIDDMESYDDEDNTIYDTWLDGWVNNTGSTVGYLEAPFAEKSVVHGGAQSMPLSYDNSMAPYYSEAERSWTTPQDWTANGADALHLYFQGRAPAFFEDADGNIIMSAIGTDVWGETDQFRYAYKRLSDDGSITVRVDDILSVNAWAKGGVMIREDLTAYAANAYVFLTPSNGVNFQNRPAPGAATANVRQSGPTAPYWVKLTRAGNMFTAQQSEDGVTWVDVVAAPIDVPMANDVYIGLAVTSHVAATATHAEFANISTTGGVTGTWELAEIGVEQPEGNSVEPIYVAVEDSAGHVAQVNYPAGTIEAGWMEWIIPHGDFSGVNLAQVEAMYIGVGDPDAPSAGGSGLIFVDDLGFGHPLPAE